MPAVKQLNFGRNERRGKKDPYSLKSRYSSRGRSRKSQGSGFLDGVYAFFSSLGFGNSQFKYESDSDAEDSQSDSAISDAEADAPQMRHEADLSQTDASSAPLQPPPSSSTRSFIDLNENSLLEWATRKVQDKSPMNDMELLGLKAFVESASERTYEPERLRFSSRPLSDDSRSPGAASDASMAASDSRRSVFSGMSTLPTFTNNVSGSNSRRRMLKKDPNGTVVWRGAGRSRNSIVQPRQAAKVDSQTKPENSKRRKITEEYTSAHEPVTSTAPVVSSASGPTLNNFVSAPNQDQTKKSSFAHVRPCTTPAVSSPLRNVVTGSPPGSPPTSVNSAASGSTSQTKAASVLSAIVEEATPPPKPDIANPYEVAAPIKPVAKPKDRKRLNERRKAQEEATKAKESQSAQPQKEKELSAKSIIEATVPKGAKRSRPPPGIGKFPQSSSSKPNVEAVSDPSPPKKFRTVTIEDADEDSSVRYEKPVEIVEPQESTSRPHTTAPINYASTSPKKPAASLFGIGKSSAPKEPSKLRNTIIATDDSENENPSLSSSSPPRTKSTASVNGFSSSAITSKGVLRAVQMAHDPKGYAMAMDEGHLDSYPFSATMPLPKFDDRAARAYALRKPLDTLPTFDFQGKKASSADASTSKPAPSATVAFDFAKAGLKPLAKPKDGEWECSTCMLKNPASATEKCTTCEAPRPGAVAKPAVKAFDWSAMKAPASNASSGGWTCGTCMLSNPATAIEKCTVCESPR